MIRIICLGKIKEDYLTKLIEDYKNRISKYHKIEIIELKDENDLETEAQNIQKYIKPRDYTIACCIEGKAMTSEELAQKIDSTFQTNGTINFIIGSSLGLAESVKNSSDMLLSFSRFTLPHGLFRGVLLEQIYRSFKINNNESYHK